MSQLRVSLEGHSELQKALLAAADDITDAASIVVAETAADIETDVKLMMQQGPATGRYYKRRSVVHRASAAGEPPAPDTGALLGSVYHERIDELNYVAGSRMVYAAYLEFGTRKIAPRPTWVPVVEKMRIEFPKAIEAALAGELR